MNKSKDGYEIIARSCAEGNSSIVVERSPSEYELRFACPIADDNGEPVSILVYHDRAEAVRALRDFKARDTLAKAKA